MKTDSTPPKPATMSERRTTILGGLLTAIGPISMAIYTPAMPELVHAFGTTEAAIKLSLSLYLPASHWHSFSRDRFPMPLDGGRPASPSCRSTLSAP